MNITKNQKGFGAVELLLILIIIAILGFVGWFVWQGKQRADKSHNSTAAISNFEECKKSAGSHILLTYPGQCMTKDGRTFVDSADTQAQELVIKEWGVKMQLQPELGTTTYKYTANDGPQTSRIDFVSDLASQVPQECGGQGLMNFSIQRFKGDKPESNPSFTKKIGANYYIYIYPQIRCDADQSGVVKKLNTDYNLMFDSLRATD